MSGKRKTTSSASPDAAPTKTPRIAYDSDDEPPHFSKNDLLIWRLDPLESHSDWTIVVANKNTDTDGKVTNRADTYHVHKAHLATGPRKSEYFTRLFEDGGRFAESKTNTSRIELDELAANAIPDVLDYMYAPESKFKVNTENATALHYLGGYFEIRRLRWDAKQFWQKDLSIETCPTYYDHSRALHDEKILEAAAKVGADSLLQIGTCSPLVQVPDPDFWLTILQNTIVTTQLSLHASKLIAAFCSNVDLGADVFGKLTHDKYLPNVHFDAAITLIKLESSITIPDAAVLTSLQKRCIKALAAKWQALDVKKDNISSILCKQNPLLLTELLSKCLSVAVTKVKTVESAFSSVQSNKAQLQKSLSTARAQLTSAATVNNSYLGELHKFVRVSDTSKCFVEAGPDDSAVIGPKSIIYSRQGAVYKPSPFETLVPNKKYPVFYFDSDRAGGAIL